MSNILLVDTIDDNSEQAIPRSTCDVPLAVYVFNAVPPLEINGEEISIFHAEHLSRTRAPANPCPNQILITADREILMRYYMSGSEEVEGAIRRALEKLGVNADSW